MIFLYRDTGSSLTPKNMRLMSALILVLALVHKSVIKMGKKNLTVLLVVLVQTSV